MGRQVVSGKAGSECGRQVVSVVHVGRQVVSVVHVGRQVVSVVRVRRQVVSVVHVGRRDGSGSEFLFTGIFNVWIYAGTHMHGFMRRYACSSECMPPSDSSGT